MKITIIGATGQTGKLLVSKALLRGHQVIAFARNPLLMSIQHQDLEFVQGDGMDFQAVESAIKGADAVICGIAPSPKSPEDLMWKTAENIVTAMNKHNVDRLIWTTGAGVRGPKDQPTLLQKSIESLLKFVSGRVLKNSEQGVKIIKESGLRWTIARAPMLINKERNSEYRVSPVGPDMKPSLTRENFAEFILDTIEGENYLYDMPAISDL